MAARRAMRTIGGLALAALVACQADAPPSTAPVIPDEAAKPEPEPEPEPDDDPCASRFQEVVPCPGRGLYDDTVSVVLVPPQLAGPVRYTLDGSVPTAETGQIAAGPIEIAPPDGEGVVVLRAAVEDGPVTTATYVFVSALLTQPELPPSVPETWGVEETTPGDYALDPRIVDADPDAAIAALSALPIVAVTMHPDDLWGPAGVYMNPELDGPDQVRPATVEWLEPGSPELLVDAGISVQGGSSTQNWKSDKLSLRLRFSKDYGPGELDATHLFEAPGAKSFDTLVLDAHLNLTWTHPDHEQRIKSQYVRDAVIADLQSSVGGLAPRSRFVHLLLNGLYWGVYDLHERPDGSFAAHHEGGDEDAWDAVRHTGEVVDGDAVAWDALLAAARADLSDPLAWAGVQAWLEVDDFIDYLLVNLYAGNTDWPHHNWYATRPHDGSIGWRFHSWDAEHTFKELDDDVTGVDAPGGPGELYQALLAQPDFAAAFTARAEALLATDGLLGPAAAQATYDARIAEIEAAVVLESARWGDNQEPDLPYSIDDWQAELDWLRADYFPARTEVVRGQLGLAGSRPRER